MSFRDEWYFNVIFNNYCFFVGKLYIYWLK